MRCGQGGTLSLEEKELTEPEAGAMWEKHHAAIAIFLEFFAWGLLTTPMLTDE